jgi:hypothetical protein
VATVEGMFEKLDYPIDVIWLDIDHTDGMRYFTVSFWCFDSYCDLWIYAILLSYTVYCAVLWFAELY